MTVGMSRRLTMKPLSDTMGIDVSRFVGVSLSGPLPCRAP